MSRWIDDALWPGPGADAGGPGGPGADAQWYRVGFSDAPGAAGLLVR